jgi:hypothetical protein
MNTTKNNIEHHIKKQISEREIAPSRNFGLKLKPSRNEKLKNKNKLVFGGGLSGFNVQFGSSFVF